MTILSLDQSSNVSGYAIFEDAQLKSYGAFSFSDKESHDRLVKIRQQIIQMIEQYHPDYVVLEDIQQQNNVSNNIQTFKILAEVIGVITETLTEFNIKYELIHAVSWKTGIGIKGKARKEQKKNAQLYVLNKYGLRLPEDVCDAICLGAYYLQEQYCPWSN